VQRHLNCMLACCRCRWRVSARAPGAAAAVVVAAVAAAAGGQSGPGLRLGWQDECERVRGAARGGGVAGGGRRHPADGARRRRRHGGARQLPRHRRRLHQLQIADGDQPVHRLTRRRRPARRTRRSTLQLGARGF
jgi:hypothetical protein